MQENKLELLRQIATDVFKLAKATSGESMLHNTATYKMDLSPDGILERIVRDDAVGTNEGSVLGLSN